MNLSEFDYILPKERIAQEALADRTAAKLMVLPAQGEREHRRIQDLPKFFRKGDVLILNDTRVTRSKLLGKKETGGKVDCLVLPEEPTKISGPVREALVRGSKIHNGSTLTFESGFNGSRKVLKAKVLERLGGAKYSLEFDRPELIDQIGELPLPPYIKQKLEEPERYQTTYSRNDGSLAAPTAGLHFTPQLMDQLKEIGVEMITLTLHIGIGTFAPIRTETLEEWKMHPEYYEVSEESAARINQALTEGRRCFAVGTTSIRTLESVTRNRQVQAGAGSTEIFIYPGYQFQFPYSGILTNFHLPKSTLLLLISAFAGKDRLMAAYAEAIQNQYRFYSLGDAMLILQ